MFRQGKKRLIVTLDLNFNYSVFLKRAINYFAPLISLEMGSRHIVDEMSFGCDAATTQPRQQPTVLVFLGSCGIVKGKPLVPY